MATRDWVGRERSRRWNTPNHTADSIGWKPGNVKKTDKCWECAGYGCPTCGEYPEDGDCPVCTVERLCASCTWREAADLDDEWIEGGDLG